MSKRITWLDTAKGIGILLVVIGHSFRDEMLNVNSACFFIKQFIYSFHMQLFFVLSGYLFAITFDKSSSNMDVVKKKTKTLLIPYIVYSLLIYLAFRGANLIPFIEHVLKESSYSLIGVAEYTFRCLLGNNPYAIHLWFLLVLFIFESITLLVKKIIGNKADYILLVISIIMYLIGMNINPSIIGINAFLKRYVFFILGLHLYNNKRVIESRSIVRITFEILSIGIIVFDIYFGDTIVNPIIRQIYYMVLLAVKFLMVFLIIRLAIIIQKIKILNCFGRNSFVIYLLHQPLCALVGVLLYNFFHLDAFIVCIICILTSIALPFLYLWLIRKNNSLRKISKFLLNIS